MSVTQVRLLRFVAKRGLRLVRGSGQYVWDSDGRRYLDFHTGHGAAFLGHSNPVICSRVAEQAKRMIVCNPTFDSDVLDEVLGLLDRILPSHLRNVYFMNSGSEAVELALKIARKKSRRKKIASFTGSFHGRTMAALSVTFNPKYREGYDPFPWEHSFLPFNDVSSIARIDEGYAAVIVEPIQGEGGLSVATSEFMRAVEERCRSIGAYMIVDEVQSGFGRSGLLWAHLDSGVRPDIMVAGKSIGGGFPVSIVAVSDEIAEMISEGEHGSTHGGNPLALAALAGAIEVQLSENVAQRAREMGEVLSLQLREIAASYSSLVRGVRGKGLMIGLELRTNPSPIIQLLQRSGLLALKAGTTVLRFLPPYLITHDDVETSMSLLSSTLSQMAERRADNRRGAV